MRASVQPLLNVGVCVVPFGVALVRLCKLFQASRGERPLECKSIRPAAILGSKLPLLLTAFGAPVRTAQIEAAYGEAARDVLRCDRIERLPHSLARPDAIRARG